MPTTKKADKPKANRTTKAPPEDGFLFAIDQDALAKAGFSFQFMVYARLCREGKCTVCKKHGTKEITPMPKVSDMIRAVGSWCSKTGAFLTPSMTLGEVAFRLLVKNNNKPVSVAEIREGLQKAWADVIHLKDDTAATIIGTLSNSNDYFIRRVDGGEGAE